MDYYTSSSGNLFGEKPISCSAGIPIYQDKEITSLIGVASRKRIGTDDKRSANPHYRKSHREQGIDEFQTSEVALQTCSTRYYETEISVAHSHSLSETEPSN
jgi:hypothetical protein